MTSTRPRTPSSNRAIRSPRELRRSAPLFAALGDDTRLGLVGRLCARGPLSTTRLAEGIGVTRQAVSKHLEVLAAAGVLRSRRFGRERVWELESASLQAAQEWLDLIAREWSRALGRQRSFAAE